MAGLIGGAPIYLNGVLSLLFVFVLPGLALVDSLEISEFPRRWLFVVLTSLTISHALVVAIAALHLDPLLTFRIATIGLFVILGMRVFWRVERRPTLNESVLTSSDLRLLITGLVLFGLAYFNLWKAGLPNVFGEGDVSISWNNWALIWAKAGFPSGALGYPQFIPTVWAVTYIFTGSTEQYFAFYIYVGLITIPLLLTMMTLGRAGWWQPLMFAVSYVWFVAEIQEGWLKSTLPHGFPDWVVIVFAFCGFAVFAGNFPAARFDRTWALAAVTAVWMLSIAAATKPMTGLVAFAVLIATIFDGVRLLEPAMRSRLLAAAVGIVALFLILYGVYYAHLAVRGMPNYPVTELSQRLLKAWRLFNANFTWPFKIVIVLGLLCGPFVPRVRWAMPALYLGIAIWANTASYDLRNALGFLLISAFISINSAGRTFLSAKLVSLGNAQWRAKDAMVAAILIVFALATTSSLAMSDSDIKRKFASDQFAKGLGVAFNREIGELLERGCTLFTSSSYIGTIDAFQRYTSRIEFFFYALPLDTPTETRFRSATGCVSVLYPPDLTTPSMRSFINDYIQSRGLITVRSDLGMILAASR